MRRARPIVRNLALLACAFASAVGCHERQRERLAIGYVKQPAAGLLFLADKEGLLREERLDVNLVEFSTGRDALRAAMDGRVDVATVYTTPVLLQMSKTPPRILTMLHQSGQNTALVARADRGIRTAQDLRGKIIGLPRDTNAEFFVRTLLELAGIAWEDVRVVDMQPQDLPDALAAGRIDAAAIWTPLRDRAERALGLGGSVTLVSEVYTDMSMLVARPEVVAARRPALRALLRGLARAERIASAEPDRVLAAVRSAIPDMSDEDLRLQLQRFQLRLGTSHFLVQNLRSEAEWFIRAGRLPATPVDPRSLVVTDLLDEVEPELVTLEASP